MAVVGGQAAPDTCRGLLWRRHVVAHAARHEPAADVGERSVVQVPGHLGRTGERPTLDRGPLRHRCVPPRTDGTPGQGGPAVEGGEVDRCAPIVERDLCGDLTTSVGQTHLEGVLSGSRPRRVRSEHHRGCQQDRIVEIGRQLTDVELLAGAIRDGEQAEHLAEHPSAAAHVGVVPDHRDHLRRTETHREDPGDIQAGVVLERHGIHPRPVDTLTEPSGEAALEGPHAGSPDDAHEAQVPLDRLVQVGDLLLGHGRVVTRPVGQRRRRDVTEELSVQASRHRRSSRPASAEGRSVQRTRCRPNPTGS